MTARLTTREFTDRGVRHNRVHVGNLLPEFTRGPADRVADTIMLDHMTPVSTSTLGAEELFEPFIAQNQNRVGLNHQP